MKNRIKFHCDDVQEFESSVGALNNTYKGIPSINKPRLTNLKRHVQSRYSEYGALFIDNNLYDISQSTRTAEEKESLIYLYETNNKKIKALKENIRKTQDKHLQFICPYCGILPATTIDHYLPKEEHPDFAILSSNLIWVCGSCNGKKLNHWRDPTSRSILNFYTDVLPRFRFINCNLTPDNGVLSASWEVLSYRLVNYPIIEKHFRRLGVIDLFNEHASTKLGELIADISSYKSVVTAEQVEKILFNKYVARIKNFGVNDYNASLLRAFILGKHHNQYL